MKYYPVLLLLLLTVGSPVSLMAEEDAGKKIVIVQGKKFIPLKDARRFYGTRKPMPTPVIEKYQTQMRKPMVIRRNPQRQQQALPVVKPQETVQPISSQPVILPKTLAPISAPAENAITADKPLSGVKNDGTAASKVLSIFAPEEQVFVPSPVK